MIFYDYKDFPRVGRIIGLDWGGRRCGVALADLEHDFVFSRPSINVKNQSELVDAVLNLIAEESAVGIVLGLPLRGDGTDSETTICVREFADMLSKKTELPILFVEENLTSSAAQDELRTSNISKIKQKLDSISARIILENAIAMIKRN